MLNSFKLPSAKALGLATLFGLTFALSANSAYADCRTVSETETLTGNGIAKYPYCKKAGRFASRKAKRKMQSSLITNVAQGYRVTRQFERCESSTQTSPRKSTCSCTVTAIMCRTPGKGTKKRG